MDQHTAERHTAHCAGLWAAARNRRRYNARTAAEAKTAATTARRNQRKARAYTALADISLICAVLATAIGFNHLTPHPANDVLLITTIALAFGANEILGRVWTNAFGPSINRLRGLPTTDNTEGQR
ncbi:MAG: hypothetical protein HOY79_04795 [Streptomyces sp.]|nr:hypothetical protein [Streptomyces sp.]NUS15402.1 hypothetical protein [Streptomyces sp.]NUS24017.1 hypothetical protein [Streptomyces sp.]